MKITDVDLICFSATQTTARTAQAIGAGTGLPVRVFDITAAQGQAGLPAAFGADELAVVGVPVYGGRVPPLAAARLAALQGSGTPCVLLCLYGNRAFDDALAELYDLLAARGFRAVAAAAFVGEHTFSARVAGGRPGPDDLAEARCFGRAVARKLAAAPAVPALDPSRIPGGRPYKAAMGALPFSAVAGEGCTRCGRCVAACPAGALSLDGAVTVDGAKCIACRACARVCPAGAIDLPAPVRKELAQHVEQAFGKPDKPNLTIL